MRYSVTRYPIYIAVRHELFSLIGRRPYSYNRFCINQNLFQIYENIYEQKQMCSECVFSFTNQHKYCNNKYCLTKIIIDIYNFILENRIGVEFYEIKLTDIIGVLFNDTHTLIYTIQIGANLIAKTHVCEIIQKAQGENK